MRVNTVKRDAAKKRLDAARAQVEVLSRGIGQSLLTCDVYRVSKDAYQPIIDIVNGALFEAVCEAERAQLGYWLHRRRRVARAWKKKPAKVKVSKVK